MRFFPLRQRPTETIIHKNYYFADKVARDRCRPEGLRIEITERRTRKERAESAIGTSATAMCPKFSTKRAESESIWMRIARCHGDYSEYVLEETNSEHVSRKFTIIIINKRISQSPPSSSAQLRRSFHLILCLFIDLSRHWRDESRARAHFEIWKLKFPFASLSAAVRGWENLRRWHMGRFVAAENVLRRHAFAFERSTAFSRIRPHFSKSFCTAKRAGESIIKTSPTGKFSKRTYFMLTYSICWPLKMTSSIRKQTAIKTKNEKRRELSSEDALIALATRPFWQGTNLMFCNADAISHFISKSLHYRRRGPHSLAFWTRIRLHHISDFRFFFPLRDGHFILRNRCSRRRRFSAALGELILRQISVPSVRSFEVRAADHASHSH